MMQSVMVIVDSLIGHLTFGTKLFPEHQPKYVDRLSYINTYNTLRASAKKVTKRKGRIQLLLQFTICTSFATGISLHEYQSK